MLKILWIQWVASMTYFRALRPQTGSDFPDHWGRDLCGVGCAATWQNCFPFAETKKLLCEVLDHSIHWLRIGGIWRNMLRMWAWPPWPREVNRIGSGGAAHNIGPWPLLNLQHMHQNGFTWRERGCREKKSNLLLWGCPDKKRPSVTCVTSSIIWLLCDYYQVYEFWGYITATSPPKGL